MPMFLVCPEHGDLYEDTGASPGDPVESAKMVPCRDDIDKPHAGDEIRCPLCARGTGGPNISPAVTAEHLWFEYRPAMTSEGCV